MRETYKVTVSAPEQADGVLDAIQALDLVRDFFGILKSNVKDISLDILTIAVDDKFTVECVPYSEKTQEIDYSSVEQNANDFLCICNAVLATPPDVLDLNQSMQDRIQRLLKRNFENDFHADYDLGPLQKSVVVVPESARRAIHALKFPAATLYPCLDRKGLKSREFGTVDGGIVKIGRRRGAPALLIADRARRKNIWCILMDSEIQKWQEKLIVAEAWSGKRFSVRGQLVYDEGSRQLIEVIDGYLNEVEVPGYDISPEDLHDPDFTCGLSTEEFLRRRWEGVNS